DPDLLKDIDPSRVAKDAKASGQALTKFRSYLMNDEMPWTVVSIPTVGWAKKVFLNETEEKAVELLWEEILKTVRLNEAEPMAPTRRHNDPLEQMRKKLNEIQ